MAQSHISTIRKQILRDLKEIGATRVVISNPVYQYRYNGVSIEVEIFNGEEDITKKLDLNEDFAENFLGAGIRRGMHEYLEGDYILKKLAFLEGNVELFFRENGSVAEPVTVLTQMDIEIGTDY